MRMFSKKDGGIIQLIDKEKMMEWPIELPLIFVEYIREKQIEKYEDSKVKKEISEYLNEILNDIAMPRLISLLEGDNQEEILLALERIKKLAQKNLEMARPIVPYLGKLSKNKNKKIVKLAKSISSSFEKAERTKFLAKKRKTMQEKESLFLEGKISAEEYAKYRKEYLILKNG